MPRRCRLRSCPDWLKDFYIIFRDFYYNITILPGQALDRAIIQAYKLLIEPPGLKIPSYEYQPTWTANLFKISSSIKTKTGAISYVNLEKRSLPRVTSYESLYVISYVTYDVSYDVTNMKFWSFTLFLIFLLIKNMNYLCK